MLRPAPLSGSSSPLGLLNRGPEYLRRQLEGGNGARSPSAVQCMEAVRRQLGVASGVRSPSAVERLEADKAKYVKTQQVVNTRQDPALATTPSCARKLLSAWTGPGQHGTMSPSKATSSRQAAVVRRSSGKRLLRPDSLVMYRQQRDCKAVNKENAKGSGLVRRLFQGSSLEKHSDGLAPPPEGASVPWILMERASASASVPTCGQCSPSPRRVAVPCLAVATAPRSPALCPRSLHPEVLSPQSRAPEGSQCVFLLKRPLSPSEQDSFFDGCGLDREELLHMQRVSPTGPDGSSSSSVSSAESTHSTHSQDSDLEEGSLAEEGPSSRARSPVSVIERNARVIRWLYSCQKAQTAKRESSV